MNQYTYLTGRKELFDNAPANAMVVLEHEDGRLFFAVAHDMGALYWNEDGTEGSKVGLIALHKKTRVVASRTAPRGFVAAEQPAPKPANQRAERMQQAQQSLAKAAAPKPAPEPAKPAPVKLDPPTVTPKIEAAPSGFVSIFELTKASSRPQGEAFITIGRNKNINVSKLVADAGDRVDFQADFARGLVRVGRVETGGRVLNKVRQFSSVTISQLFTIPEGQSSVRIELELVDGWWQGEAKFNQGAA